MYKPANLILNRILSFALILFVLTSCSDSSTGVDDELMEPPPIPEAIPVEVGIDYFNILPDYNELTEAAYEAAGYALLASFTLTSGTAIGISFLELAQSNDAEFNNGTWQWAYTFQQGSESLSIRVTARTVSSGYEWKVFLSGNFSGLGQSLDEFLYLSGTVNDDGSSGNWNFFTPDSQIPLLTYSWNITSATVYEAEYQYTDPDDGTIFTIGYERDGVENYIFLTGDDFGSGIDVYWNTATFTGYIIEEGVKTCWDSNFEETVCS